MNRHKLLTIAIAGGIVIVLALGWAIGVSPVLAQAASADAQRSSIATSNQASQASIVVLKAKFAGIGALSKKLGDLTDSIPTDANIPAFLRELDGLSNSNSVGLSGVVVSDATHYVPPAPVVPTPASSVSTPSPSPTPSPSSTTPATTGPVVPAGATGRLVLIPVKITVSGTYNDIMAFAGGLQSGPRLYLISTLTVTGSVDQPSQYTGGLSGYVYALPLPTGVKSLAESAAPSPSATPTPSATLTPTPTPTK